MNSYGSEVQIVILIAEQRAIIRARKKLFLYNNFLRENAGSCSDAGDADTVADARQWKGCGKTVAAVVVFGKHDSCNIV